MNKNEIGEFLTPKRGEVHYWDLCKHENVSKEEFFGHCGLKELITYGLILIMTDVVKVLTEDDVTGNEECHGIVIPRNCIILIDYYDELDSEDNSGSTKEELN